MTQLILAARIGKLAMICAIAAAILITFAAPAVTEAAGATQPQATENFLWLFIMGFAALFIELTGGWG